MNKTSRNLIFKNYDQNQPELLPSSLEELIESNYPVRVASQVIDQINIDVLLKQYKPEAPRFITPECFSK